MNHGTPKTLYMLPMSSITSTPHIQTAVPPFFLSELCMKILIFLYDPIPDGPKMTKGGKIDQPNKNQK